jgi:nucleotide-binding universal stress UspA family protein
MKRILVPTDFSENSKAGIRFALQWSTIEELELIFVHVVHTLRPLQWNDDYFLKYVKEESGIIKEKLYKFVNDTFEIIKIKPQKYQCIILQGFSADLSIVEYCDHPNNIHFVCISTAGAGKLKKILGTNTGNLITKSSVPIIAVPKDYKPEPIKRLIYASDFRNCDKELKAVVVFARGLNAEVEVLHFNWPDETSPDEDIIESGMREIFKFPLKLQLEKPDIKCSLVENLQKYIEVSKPSLVIMFTDQNRTIFQKIFLSSSSEQVSFHLKTPLLVFKKDV